MSAQIAFIGLGNIGEPMCTNLLVNPEGERSEWHVTAFDVRPEAVAKMVAKGASEATDLAQLAARCQLIFLCVRDDADVSATLYGEGGLLAHAQPGTLIAIHSTVSQAGLRKWVADAAERELELIDAPVTGGADGANKRQLCYMVGGSATALERCRPVFATSAGKIIHAGELGAGLALKLCNNAMSYAAFIAIHEATKLAAACGLDSKLLYEVGSSNGVVTAQMHSFINGRDGVFASGGAKAVAEIFAPFGHLAQKDLDAALASAVALGVELPGAERSRELILNAFLKAD